MSAYRQVNASRRSSPRRKARIGQNFLVDAGAARRIVEALGNIGSSVVVEIGSGRGALTSMLADRAGFLIATELDEQLASQLQAAFGHKPNVKIVQANFLNVPLSELVKGHPLAARGQRVRVVGNIPYYITSDILLHLFKQHSLIETIVLMVQKEVADRLAATPGSRNYGLLTVTTQLFAAVERLFTLPPGAFSPSPQVHSSVLRLRIAPREGTLKINPETFLSFCRQAFAQKRKTLLNNLRPRYSESAIKAALGSAKLREDVRAEAVSLQDLALTFRELSGDIP